jgi:polyisoprenoid-binding protein YceI
LQEQVHRPEQRSDMSSTTTSISNPAIRIVGDEEVPVAGTYAIDASHSQVGFAVRHMMVSRTRGRFSDFAGTVEIGENPLDSSVSVTIQSASIDTRDEQRDGHLRSGDFFDAEAWPTITYQSRSVRQVGNGEYIVEGDLTIKGVTQPVPLELTFEGGGSDPVGQRTGRVLGQGRARPRGLRTDVEPGARDRRRPRRQEGGHRDRGGGRQAELVRRSPHRSAPADPPGGGGTAAGRQSN